MVSISKTRSRRLPVFLLVFAFLLGATDVVAGLVVEPAHSVVFAGSSTGFVARDPVTSSIEAVYWSVETQPGTDVGSIDNNGFYLAPNRVPPSGEVRIRAESQVTPGLIGFATVEIASPTADGSFVPAVVASTVFTNSSANITVADFDGDGIPDLWNYNPVGTAPSIFHKGLGDGSFAAPVTTPGGGLRSSASTRVADMDGDGLLDLVGPDGRGEQLFIILSNGDGTFRNGDAIGFGASGLIQPVVADLDGDGDQDVAITDAGDFNGWRNRVYIFLNDGGGTLTQQPFFYNTDGHRPFILRGADVNADGHLDLVALNHGEFNHTIPSASIIGSVAVLLNDGNGVFGAPVLFDPWSAVGSWIEPSLLEVADLDGDGFSDLVVQVAGAGFPRELRVHLGLGDGGFDPVPVTAGLNPSSGNQVRFALAHSDSDDRLDLLWITRRASGSSPNPVLWSSVVERWSGDGFGGFTYAGDALSGPVGGATFSTIEVTSLNNDGQYDLWLKQSDPGFARSVATALGGPASIVPGLQISAASGMVNTGLSLSLSTQLTGTLETGVEWSVNGIVGGNDTVGTIEIVDTFNVRYHPPAVLGSLSSVEISAVNGDGSLSASFTVELTDYLWLQSSSGLTDLNVYTLEWAADGSRLYAGTSSAVFYSTDAGISWSGPSSGLPSTLVRGLAVDPTDPLIVYAATVSGPYKSIDGGQTWTAISSGIHTISSTEFNITIGNTGDIEILPAAGGQPQALLATFDAIGKGYGGLVRSTDGGASWRTLPDISRTFGNKVRGHPSDPDIAYAVVSGHIYYSGDRGGSWTELDAGSFNNGIRNLWIDPFDGSHLILYASTYTTTGSGTVVGPQTLYESFDDGASWTDISSSLGGSNDAGFAFDPTTPATAITALSPQKGPFLSTSVADFKWHDIGDGFEVGSSKVDTRFLAVAPAGAASPGAFYAATPNGVYISGLAAIAAGPQLPITPTLGVIPAGSTLTLSVLEAANWSLQALPGIDGGTLSVAADGLSVVYTAPAAVPPSGDVRIRAESQVTPGLIGFATVEIASPTADGSFVPAVVASTVFTNSSANITVADFDGDGIPDLWNYNPVGTAPSIFHKGLGDGSFAAPVTTPGGGLRSSASTRVADMDGDGLLDLVGPDGRGEQLFIILSNGDGTFRNGNAIGFGASGLIQPVVADLDGDGDQDVAITDAGDFNGWRNRVYIFLNDGGGTLTQQPFFYNTDGHRPFILRGADVNADGHLDLVALNHGEFNHTIPSASIIGSVAVLLNDGNGVFGAPVLFDPWSAVGSWIEPSLLEVADLDGDGFSDLVVQVAGAGFPRELRVHLGLGDGGFDPVPVTAGLNPSSGNQVRFALAHSDSDDRLDLLWITRRASGSSPNPVLWSSVVERWSGDGFGGFTYAGDALSGPVGGATFSTIEVTSLNNDGQYDLWLKQSDPGFARSVATALGGPASIVPGLQISAASGMVNTGLSLSLSTQLTGTLETGVEWSVNGIVGGNDTVGTIEIVDTFNVRYHPPAVLGSLSSVEISAVNGDGSLSASFTVELTDYLWLQSSSGLTDLNVYTLEWAADGSRLYAGTSSAVFYSTDAGISWSGPSSGLPSTLVRGLAVDPTDPLIVYAATVSGPYKSIDGGQTWTAISSGIHTISSTEFNITIGNTGDIEILPAAGGQPQALLATFDAIGKGYGGLVRSTDGGASWRTLPDISRTFGNKVRGHPSDPDIAYAVVSGHIYYSGDRGGSWTELDAGSFNNGIRNLWIDPFDGSHLILYASTYTTTGSGTVVGPQTLYESFDDGASWTDISSSLGGSNDAGFAFDPTTPATAITALSPQKGPFLSTSVADFKWHDIGDGFEVGSSKVDTRFLAVAPAGAASPGAFYAATPNGVYISGLAAIAAGPQLPITPTLGVIPAGSTLTLSVLEAANWSLQALPGIDGGTLSVAADGLSVVYTAPAAVPPSGDVRIRAESQVTPGLIGFATVEIASPTADGSFVPAVVASTVFTNSSANITVADFDGDGIPDLWNYNPVGTAPSIFHKGLGDGSFAAPVTTPGGGLRSSASTRVADMDGDGLLDLVGPDGRGEQLFIILSNGDGTFRNGNAIGFGASGLIQPVVADLDGDGDQDVAITDAGDFNGWRNRVYIFLNDGGGTLTQQPFFYNTDGHRPFILRGADVNADGHLDLVALNHGEFNHTIPSASIIGSVAVLLNDGNGVFGAPVLFDPWSAVGSWIEPSLLEVADLDGDGFSDLVVQVAGAGFPRELRVHLGLGDGGFDPVPVTAGLNPSSGNQVRFALAHSDSDDRLDLLWITRRASGSSPNPVLWSSVVERWSGDGFGGFTYAGDALSGPVGGATFSTIEVTSLNNDGQYDLWLKQSDPGFARSVATALGGPASIVPGLQISAASGMVNTGLSLSLSTQLTGTLETGVEWSVNGIVGGNDTVGTIEIVDTFNVRYHPPAVLGSLSSVEISAVNGDGSLSASFTVELTDYLWLQSSSGLTDLNVYTLEWAADGSRLYAGTSSAVFYSTDAGISWSGPSSGLPSTLVRGLAVDPTDPLIVYAATVSGPYKSIDGGQTWTAISSGIHTISSTEFNITIGNTGDIEILPAAGGQPQALLATFDAIGKGYGGLVRSTDGGASWRTLPDISRTFGNKVRGHPSDPDIAYAVVSGHIYYSGDRGGSWTELDAGSFNNGIRNLWIDPFDGSHLILYASTYTTTGSGTVVGPQTLYESFDDGASWTDISSSLGGSNDAGFAFDPTTPATAITALSPQKGPFLSTSVADFKWHDIGDGFEVGSSKVDTRFLAVAPAGAASPGAFYAATPNGVYTTFTGTDSDGDGVVDSTDNCTDTPNANQLDSNGDGYGNACDADLNDDGIVNVLDLGLFKLVIFSADADADFNGDGIVNVVDLGLLKTMFFKPPGPSGIAP